MPNATTNPITQSGVTMSTTTTPKSIAFFALPAIGADLDGGEFAGITTKPDGTHWAVTKLPGYGEALDHDKALADAKERGGELPTKAVAALVVANLKVKRGWYWTCETYDASYAWGFYSYGYTNTSYRSAEGGALAVRLIQITA